MSSTEAKLKAQRFLKEFGCGKIDYDFLKKVVEQAFFASAELAKEYARESNDRAKYTPVEGDYYWRCACGAINEKEDSTCYQCHAEKTQLFGLLNVKLISDNLTASQFSFITSYFCNTCIGVRYGCKNIV